MQVKELMSRDVVSVPPDETVAVAARLLSRGNIGAVPVCGDGGGLRGLVTDRDIVLRCVAAGREPARTPVREIMTSRIVSAAPGDDVEAAARLMAREQVRRLPVEDGGRVVGMLSLGDLSVNSGLQTEASECLSEICSNLHHR